MATTAPKTMKGDIGKQRQAYAKRLMEPSKRAGSKRPTQATSFKTYPMTGAPQGNESPVRGEGPTQNSNEV